MADPSRPSPVSKTEVWTLGLLGVDVVNAPHHLVDGDLLLAQNAEPFVEEGEGGLRKRLGLELFTPDTLPSGISAITSIPLPDPFVPYPTEGAVLYAMTSTDGGPSQYYQISEDGITWDDDDTTITMKFQVPNGSQGDSNLVLQHGGPLTTADGIYFLDNGAGHLMLWNGNTLTTLTTNEIGDVSDATRCTTLLLHAEEIYAICTGVGFSTLLSICRFTGSAWEEVLEVDPWGPPQAACSAFGRIYVPNSTQSMGYWSADSGWVDEGIFTGNAGAFMPVTDMLATPFGLMLTFDCNGNDPDLVWVRTGPDDAWVDITPVGGGTSTWGPMAMLDGVLYMGRQIDSLLAFVGCQVWTYDGTTLAMDEDLTTHVATAYQMPAMLAFNGLLYMTVKSQADPQSHIFRRSAAGVYTVPVSELGISQSGLTGPLGFF